ncbi:MAG: LysR family transcriptional regulator [Anaerolineae bacterium]|jgi:DNA-binding transcriptional LysR family regulator|nr:LysR family transcriptional regulator [Anaerolineae bacterium]
MLDLYKLHIFERVVQAGSFSAAAEQLYMSQSAVSQHIHELEASLGTKLFDRGRRGVTLTSTGQTLHEYTRSILKLVGEAEHAVTDVQQLSAGQIMIGATPGVAVYLLPDWIQAFRADYPRLTVTLKTNVTAQIVEDVLARRMNLGFIEGELHPRPELGSVILQEVEQWVIIGEKHPWAGRESIMIAELADQPFIMRQGNSQTRQWWQQILTQAQLEPPIIAEFDNVESIKRMVMSGTCLTILPEYAVSQELESGRLRRLTLHDHPLRRALKMIWEREIPLSPITYAFVQTLARTFSALQGVPLAPNR